MSIDIGKFVICSTNRDALLCIESVNIIETNLTNKKYIGNTQCTKEISIQELKRLAEDEQVVGIKLDSNKNILSFGKLINYPYITHDGLLKNNIPVLIYNDNETVVLANGYGKTVQLSVNSAINRFSRFANALKREKSIEFLDYENNENLEQSKLLDTIIQFDTSKQNIKFNGQNQQISEIMQSHKSKSFSDLAQKFTDEALKKQKELESTRNTGNFKSTLEEIRSRQDKQKVDFEGDSGLAFEIVKVEDRVELRRYDGDGFRGDVIVPDGVTHICSRAFSGATARVLVLPETVVYLGDGAFSHSEFEEIHLSSKITAIPYLCFADTSKLTKINLNNITSIDNLAFAGSGIEEVVIDAALIQIGFEAFKDCKNLRIFKHAGTVSKIRHHAFDGCILLEEFDFSSVTTIEQNAFHDTGIKKAIIRGEVNYLQTGTFTGEINEIELLDGMYKISANAVSNKHDESIKWTVPLSVKNIEKGVFKERDIVCCYRKSVAASSAIMADAQIIYLDDIDKANIPNVIKKAQLLDASIEEILKDTLSDIISKEEQDIEYDFQEMPDGHILKGNIPDLVFDIIGDEHKYGEFASDDDIKHERGKFKCILQHLHKVAKFDILPFSSSILSLKDTFNVGNYYEDGKLAKSKVETLYSDGISKVIRIKYIDNKFESINSSFILAKTKDTLRYICMDNKYTDIMCENSGAHNMEKLLGILRPGDTIGLNNIIQGVKYPEISAKSSKKIEVTKNNRKQSINLEMNMYQALRYSSVTVKLDNNNIVLILPGNKKIIKCASLGKTVWLNEKEDTYKSLQCTIESIEDIDNNTVFDYESTFEHTNYGSLFKRFKQMKESQYQGYIESYSHIYKAEQSMYKHAGDYAYVNRISSIYDTDLNFMLSLFKTSLFEERKIDWLEGSIGKTIVPDVKAEFSLSDGSTLYQYRSVKRIALRNKLMSGGDRKLYIFELVDVSGMILGVYISLYDIETLVNMCISVNKEEENQVKKIFVDKNAFDVVEGEDVIEIAEMCKGNKLHVYNRLDCTFILGVYKPNGLYYLGLKIIFGKSFRFIPIIQIGELEVALEFIEDTNKYGINNISMSYLYRGSVGIIVEYAKEKLGMEIPIKFSKQKYLGLLKARELCIDGISDINEYNKLGIAEILKRCLGYSSNLDSYYSKPIRADNIKNNIDFDIDLDIDESEL